MNALAAYRGLLSNRPLTLLLGGEFVSSIGDWLYVVAILIVVYREAADPLVLGLFGAARILPYVLLSVPAGYVADRFDRRLVLLATDLLRGACMLGMAWLVVVDGPIIAIVGLAVLATCGSAFFYPAIGAYIPALVRDERELAPANGLFASLDNLGFVIGPAIGGVLVAGGGATFAFLINAVTFGVIAAILWRLPPSIAVSSATRRAQSADAARPAEAGEDVDALAASGNSVPVQRVPWRPLSGLMLIVFALYAFDGGIGILTVILAVDILGAGEAATGYLNAAIGLGGIVGGIVAGVLVLRRGLRPPLLVGAIVAAAAMVILASVNALPAALVGVGLYATGYYIVDVLVTTILQRILPDAARGRGIVLSMAVGTMGEVLGTIVVPVVVTSVGIAVLGPASLLLLGAVGIGLVLVGQSASRQASAAEATLGRVRRGPLFAGVPGPRLEAALARLRTVPVRAGQTIIRQGDPPDRFYLVQSGTFTVSQADAEGVVQRLRALTADDVFGELGLLTGAPRSASVIATSDGVLLALEGPDFLELVGGSGAVQGRLLGLYGSSNPGLNMR
jgi:MFS family permease